MGNNVFCSTFLFLVCWMWKATQRMWKLQASARFEAAMNLAPSTRMKHEDRWLMLWEASVISMTSLYAVSLPSWLHLKTTDTIWTLSSSASTEAALNLWTWLSIDVIAVMHGNLWVGYFYNHGLIPQLLDHSDGSWRRRWCKGTLEL